MVVHVPLLGRLGVVRLGMVGALVAWSSVLAAQDLSLSYRAGTGAELRVSASDRADRWLRIESSYDLAKWTVVNDSIVGPATVTDHQWGRQRMFYRAVPIERPDPPYLIAVIGDSTAVGDMGQDPPRYYGWGNGLDDHVDEDRFVTNIMLSTGLPGLSSKTFFQPANSYRVNILSRTRPHLVLIQLGQIDEFTSQPESKGTTLLEYRENLANIVELLREQDLVPVLLTPLPFRPDGYWYPGSPVTSHDVSRLEARSEIVRKVAQNSKVWLIDLYQMMSDLYQTKRIEENRVGTTVDAYHLSEYGSEKVAGMIIDALPSHLRGLYFGRP